MAAINTLRAILTGGAVVAAIVSAAHGRWLVVTIMGIGVAAHGLLWVWLYRDRDRRAGVDHGG